MFFRNILFILISISFLSAKNVITADLEFVPSGEFDSLSYPKANIWKTHKLLISSFTFDYDTIKEIGKIKNTDQNTIIHTKTNLPLWIENVLKYSFQKNGISVVNENPTLVLSGKISEFNVKGSNYLYGTITLEVTLSDPINNILYTGSINGQFSDSIKSICTFDCFKVCSNMMIDWLRNFLNTPKITHAATQAYHNTIILHDFNYVSENLISNTQIPKKKPRLKKVGTFISCLGIAPIITGLISKSKGNDDLAEPLFIIGSTTTSAGLTTTGISFAFDIKYNSFQSKFRKKPKIKRDITENIEDETLHSMLNR